MKIKRLFQIKESNRREKEKLKNLKKLIKEVGLEKVMIIDKEMGFL